MAEICLFVCVAWPGLRDGMPTICTGADWSDRSLGAAGGSQGQKLAGYMAGLPSDSADFGGRAAWESPQPCGKSISTLGLLGFSLNRYTSRLVNYCRQDYWFLQYDIYVSYPSGATWKELVQIAQFLVTRNLEHLLYQNTDRKRNQCFH